MSRRILAESVDGSWPDLAAHTIHSGCDTLGGGLDMKIFSLVWVEAPESRKFTLFHQEVESVETARKLAKRVAYKIAGLSQKSDFIDQEAIQVIAQEEAQ